AGHRTKRLAAQRHHDRVPQVSTVGPQLQDLLLAEVADALPGPGRGAPRAECLLACLHTEPLLKDSEAMDHQGFAGEPGLRVAYSLMYHIFGPKSQRIVRPRGIKVFRACRRPAQASY